MDRKMIKGKRIGLTLAQMLVGCCIGVLAGWFSLFWINLIWRGSWWTHLGGFLTAVLLLASFLIIYGACVVGTAEGVRQMGRFMPRQTSRRRMYEGAFLGICAAVAILTVTRGDWLTTLEEWVGPGKILGTLIYTVLILPVKFATVWIPAQFFLLIAAPVGAAIAYNIPPRMESAPEDSDSQEQPVKDKRWRSKT